MRSFYQRFVELSEQYSPFCLGIDPTPQILSQWDLPDSIDGLRQFNDIILEAGLGRLCIVKPQLAFYERFGHQGIEACEQLIAAFQAEGSLVLLDAKKGDIHHTLMAYVESGLTRAYRADAMTLTAYLGIDAMQEAFKYATDHGKSLFIVVRSSNPEGRDCQIARLNSGETVAESIAANITRFNAKSSDAFGAIGAVVGATLGEELPEIAKSLSSSLLLTPGIGAQGASLDDLSIHLKGHTNRIIPTSSRQILRQGPDISSLVEAIERSKSDVRKAFKLLG